MKMWRVKLSPRGDADQAVVPTSTVSCYESDQNGPNMVNPKFRIGKLRASTSAAGTEALKEKHARKMNKLFSGPK
jgi:hypothetical protein